MQIQLVKMFKESSPKLISEALAKLVKTFFCKV